MNVTSRPVWCCRASRAALLPALIFLATISTAAAARPRPFEIKVIDKQTRRGVPLVELVTVDDVRRVTDNAGRIAYDEPGHAGQKIFFHIRAQGYQVPKDGFGYRGVRLKIEPGKSAEVALARINVAERLYRITGQGLYRDSVLLGHKTPLRKPIGSGKVSGQDSVQTAVYRGRLFWFWGDTNRLAYPLGLFRTAGATSPLPKQGGLAPSRGVNLKYFTRDDGFARAMAKVDNPKGVVWIDGVATVPDEAGRQRLVAHFSRRPSLAKAYEQGMMLYNDQQDVFEVKTKLPLEERWRFLHSHPVRIKDGDVEYLACGHPFLTTRVPATLSAVMNAAKYQSFSCIDADAAPATAKPRRDRSGAILWKWQNGPPVTQKEEMRWLKQGLIRASEARFLPVDSGSAKRHVLMHYGTVRYNPYRKRWVLIAIENAKHRDSPSMLGEVWYSESERPQGPFRKAVRVVTHDRQSFYNPCHHRFFDEQGGRVIYFEGTYCNTFTNSPATPRYNYNQIMYRLDLDHRSLQAAFPRAGK